MYSWGFLKGLGLFFEGTVAFFEGTVWLYSPHVNLFFHLFSHWRGACFPKHFLYRGGKEGYPPLTWLIPTFQTNFISICNNIRLQAFCGPRIQQEQSQRAWTFKYFLQTPHPGTVYFTWSILSPLYQKLLDETPILYIYIM